MNFKNILVFRLGHLGDTLVSLPAFWAVRKMFPKAHLTLLSNIDAQNPQYVSAQSVLPKEGLFDNWMSYPTNLGKIKTSQAFARLFLEIRQGKFDALVYLMTRNRGPKRINRDRLFFRAAGIKNIFGTEYLLKNYLNPAAPKPLPKVESEIEYLLNCLRNEGLSIPENVARPDLLLEADEVNFAKDWLKARCGEYYTEDRLVAVAPGSKWDSKVWDEEKYAAVVEKLVSTKNFFPVIFGGLEDREKGSRLIKNWGRGANAAGELNIRRAAAALAECKLYLGNDTGTMHLAASVGVPCVAVFAAIDWRGRWTPFGRGHHIIRKDVECEGCLSPFSKNQRKCLNLIDIHEVYESCVKVLS